jgi:glycosyltransferase involved in cell wall biosynthesis
MTPRLSILVPYRPGEPWRDRSWTEAVRPAWQEIVDHLNAELIVESPGPGAHPGEFNHPRAINAARQRASGEVLVIADADTEPDPPSWIVAAAGLSALGRAHWVLPAEYWQLSAAQTQAALSDTGDWVDDPTRAEWVGYAQSWSGCVVVAAWAFDLVGGYDERWEFWGSDDAAFSKCMDTLVGPVTRLEGRCLHYWHPRPSAHHYGHERHREQHALQERYDAAAGDVEAMRLVRFGS